MAIVVGKAGNYAGAQAIKSFKRLIWTLGIFEMVIGFIVGVLIFNRTAITFIFAGMGFGFIYLLGKYKLVNMAQQLAAWQKGYTSEEAVCDALRDLPNTYYVINDLQQKNAGNIDHVVVGPSGIFAIETKSFKGHITADGSGELLLNGKRTNKKFISNFSRAFMRIREKVNILAEANEHVYGLMVFTKATESAEWSKTKPVRCISIERIPNYFLELPQDKLKKEQILAVKKAFEQLARMDDNFVEDVQEPE